MCVYPGILAFHSSLRNLFAATLKWQAVTFLCVLCGIQQMRALRQKENSEVADHEAQRHESNRRALQGSRESGRRLSVGLSPPTGPLILNTHGHWSLCPPLNIDHSGFTGCLNSPDYWGSAAFVLLCCLQRRSEAFKVWRQQRNSFWPC